MVTQAIFEMFETFPTVSVVLMAKQYSVSRLKDERYAELGRPPMPAPGGFSIEVALSQSKVSELVKAYRISNEAGIPKSAVEAAKGGEVQFRAEKSGVVQAGVGKASFDEKKLVENVKAFIDAVNKAKPSGAKGTYLKKVAVSSTMGPSVQLDTGV